MMRKCHLNTCPVGIATQDPELRKKFAGKPEHVINYFFMLAEELREIMAQLGFRTINEMVGRVDLLDTRKAIAHWKAKGLDFSNILHKPARAGRTSRPTAPRQQDHGLESLARPDAAARAVPPGARTRRAGRRQPADPQHQPHRRHDPVERGHPRATARAGFADDDTIQLNFRGSAGQSLMAFGVHGVTFEVEGDVNDYCGKGLSGGKIIVYPPRESTLRGRRQHHRRQRRPVRRHRRRGLSARHRRRTVLRPQQRRHRPWSKASAIMAANT